MARWHNCYKVLSLFLVQRSARSCWSFHPKHRKEYYIINLSLSPLASDSFPDSKGREVSLLNHDQEGCNLYTNCTPTTQPPPSGRAVTLSPGGAQICLDYKLNFDKVLCAPHLHFAVLISGGCLPNWNITPKNHKNRACPLRVLLICDESFAVISLLLRILFSKGNKSSSVSNLFTEHLARSFSVELMDGTGVSREKRE